MMDLADLSPAQREEYRRYVSQAKEEARSGNLEASVQLFQQALEIHFSERLTANVKKLEAALASLALDQEDDCFVDVCQSGLMLYEEMHDKLFDHQREGVAFLYKLYQDGRKGGILADDMGLGKTIQIIAFLSGMFDAELIRSVLLILPTTLLNNWEKEFAKWTPGLRVKVFHGTNKAERNRYLERIQRRKGILLTTYQMVLNNWQQLSSFGGKEFVWDYIILDEAHKIKTPSAKTTKSVHAIPSKNRILLTGTPVQNNLRELWALFDFACQGSLLGTLKTFKMEYENPITKAREKDATPEEKALGLKISENLMSIIKPYFLRRTKDELQKKKKTEFPSQLPEDQSKDVASAMPSLPRKNEFIVWVFLAPIQEEIYRKFISLDHIKELLTSTRSPLAELSVLKKLCDHPRLLSNRACIQLGLEASNYSEQEVGENEPVEFPDMKRSIKHVSDEMLIQESGKLSFLVALLERLQDEGHRTLVFSQSRKMLDIIERILTHRGFKLMRIDGTVTHLVEREKRIGMFQKDGDYSVFLLTTQVGGVGLTLTAASRVVIFDPSWNPATDAQAVDRTYRIGQKDNVIIYRLITCGTVEEKIYRRQVFKDSLIRQSTGDKKNPYRYFTRQELRELFTLEDTRSSATQLQLQSLHATQRKTDTKLDEHIAYLHMLEIFGISDHDLMYTRETAHEDEAENEEAHRYIEHRVQKAQELVRLESQMNDQLMRNIRNTTEGAWLRDIDSSNQPKTKPPRSSSSDTLGPSMSERTSPIVVDSPTPSMKKSPTPPPSPVVTSPVFISPVVSNEVVDLVSDDDNNVSDMVNLSSKMTSLMIEDVADEQMIQIISNTEDASPSEEKEHQYCSLQEFELKAGTGLVSTFLSPSQSNKVDCSPESRAISELPAKDTDDEQMVFHANNTDVLYSKNQEYQLSGLQTEEQNESLNVVSSFPQAVSLSVEGRVISESKMISCDPSPEARSELKNVQMKLLQESFLYPDDDGGHKTETEMSLDVLPISCGDACEIMSSRTIKDVADEQMVQIISNMKDVSPSGEKEPPSLQQCEIKPCRGLVSPFLSPSQSNKVDCSPESRAISALPANDTDDEQIVFHISNSNVLHSKNQEYQLSRLQTEEQNESLNVVSSFPQAVSLSVEGHVISESKMISCDPSPEARSELKDVQMKLLQESFLYPSDDGGHKTETEMSLDVLPISCGDACENMSSLPIEDVADEQMVQIISNTEDALPSEEKEHQYCSLQECELKAGTGLVSTFLSPSQSNKVDRSPESRAISELPAKDTDDEQMVFHANNTDVLYSKNQEYQLSRLQTEEQNESLNVVSSFPQAVSLSVEGHVISESKMISCDPSPEARSELKDVQMKLLQESFLYPSDDGGHKTETEMSLDVLPISCGDACEIMSSRTIEDVADEQMVQIISNMEDASPSEMSLDVLPISHGDACEMNELDAVAPHETRASKMTENSALQKSGVRETRKDGSFAVSSHFQVNFNLSLEESEDGPQATSEKNMSLEDSENDGFQLRLDSYCSSATESVGGEQGHPRNLQASNAVDGSVVTDDSNSPCDSRDSFWWGKKKPTAIIVSDEEDENDELIDDLDEDKPDGMCMSTPKNNRPTPAIYFSPRIKLSGRRSTASRRSLFDVVLEEVEGAPREAGTASNASNERSVQYEFEEELTQNDIEQTSEELEEEPSGEMLDSESESSHFHDTDTSRGQSSL